MAEEYQQLSRQNQYGYQEQTSARSTSWSPFIGFTHSDQVKQDRSSDDEQPQAHYPQQMPPMA